MMTKHHRCPKRFKFDKDNFFKQRSSNNKIEISEMEHRAWNVLTNSSAMTLQDIADSLSRLIPDSYKFIVVRR